MEKLVEVRKKSDIFPEFRNTPIEDLLEYHNLNRDFETYSDAKILIGMCMDNRKSIRIPDNFAYILRTGGGNLRFSEFKVSYAIAIGGITAIALIAHNHCGMVGVVNRKEKFISGMIKNAGWEEDKAIEHFNSFAPLFEIGNEIDFVLAEEKRLNERYPKILVAPLFYKLEDNLFYQIKK